MTTFEKKTMLDGMPAMRAFSDLWQSLKEKQIDLVYAQTQINFLRQFNNHARDVLTALVKGV